MFCVNCGTLMEGNTIATCPQCGKSNQPAFSAVDAGRILQSAAGDATVALRQIVRDPISGLPVAYATLGEQRARSAGIALGAAFALAMGIATAIAASDRGFGGSAKLLLMMSLVGIAPFLAMFAVSIATRKAFRSSAMAGADLLSCGVALQPFSVFFIIAAMLGIANLGTIALVSLFAWTYTLTILFTGCTKLAHVPERFAPPIIATMLLAAIWSTRVVGGWVLGGNPFGPLFGWW